jgi:molybdopterin-containing oxidoreductase family iron-sulfur binding subunit
MVIDLERCIGCNACIVACKTENGTPDDVYYTRVYTEEMGEFPDVTMTYVPALCNHCEDAPCVTVCPTGASYKREDGIVLINPDACIGCRYCMMACPYGERFYLTKGKLENGYYGGEHTDFEALKWQSFQEGTVVKCTFCAHRVDGGVDPACVTGCPTEARVFGDLEDEDSKVSVLLRERGGDPPLEEAGTKPSVFYLRSSRDEVTGGSEQHVRQPA